MHPYKEGAKTMRRLFTYIAIRVVQTHLEVGRRKLDPSHQFEST